MRRKTHHFLGQLVEYWQFVQTASGFASWLIKQLILTVLYGF